MGIKVRAMRQGYYNYSRRKVGEVFEVECEEHISDFHRPLRAGVRPGWMERMADEAPVGRPSVKTGEFVPHAFSELGSPKIVKVAKMPKSFAKEEAKPVPVTEQESRDPKAEGKYDKKSKPTGSAKVI